MPTVTIRPSGALPGKVVFSFSTYWRWMVRLQSLQILRFAAAIMVLHTHAANLAIFGGLGPGHLGAGHWGAVGGAGVDIFFVISGAIMYHSAWDIRGRPQAIDFLRRRFLRVAPLYYLATIVWLAFAKTLFGRTFDAEHILSAFTFWPVWGEMKIPPLILGWSLCFEMLFYAVFAVCMWRPKLVSWVFTAYLGFWLLREMYNWPIARFLGNPIALEFILGVLVMRWRSKFRAGPIYWWISLSVGCALILLPARPLSLYDLSSAWEGSLAVWRVIFFGLPAALLVLSVVQLDRALSGPTAQALSRLGDASYSIYLVHWGAFMCAIPLVAGLAPDLVIAVACVIGLVAGLLVHRFIEKPLLYFARKGRSQALLTGAV